MAGLEKFIRSITKTASAPASDDYTALDGATNGTRKFLLKSALDSKADLSALESKQDFIDNPTSNNIVAVDESGQVIDSGVSKSSVTTQGNSFNGNSQLIQTTSSGKYPALDGSLITNISGVVTSKTRNLIINGDMNIDQRNCGASVTPTASAFILDRWSMNITQASKLSVRQVADAPVGFSNSLKVTSLSSYTSISTDYFHTAQVIEGFNSARLAFGSSDAKNVTLSFWVKSSIAGVFAVSLGNSDGTRSYTTTYTVNNVNTWEKKTITIAGDATGTWVGATNGRGLILVFDLGCGSNYSGVANVWQSGNITKSSGATSLIGTSGATWQLTGVQLEEGSVATEFEHRLFSEELALCQRYYEKTYNVEVKPGAVDMYTGAVIALAPTTTSYLTMPYGFTTSKRAAPTVTPYNPVTGVVGTARKSGGTTDVAMTYAVVSVWGGSMYANNVSVGTGHALYLHITADAEIQ